ncbi:MAG TPA: hypothetical protein VKR83_10055 [Ktedonobacteraceae bacterium]|nr:hypothetical protein [Ktedonobacteraceae bacterium]
MIEVDSCYPSNWSTWNSSSLQPYLELHGEAQPFIFTNFVETLPADSTNNDPQMSVAAPVYEYFWTIGISEYLYERFAAIFPQHGENIVNKEINKFRNHDLETGAEVTLYFPLTGGWRVESIVASIKYVRPLPHQEDFGQKVAQYWDTVAPVVSKVADLTEQLNIPGVSAGATLINTLTKAPITSLPPVDGLSWSIKRVTGYVDSQIMDGVHWTLPKKLFYILGTRLTGSIAVYFHPAQGQQKQQEDISNNPSTLTVLQPGSIVAQAVVHDDGKQYTHIEEEQKKYIALDVRPAPMPVLT